MVDKVFTTIPQQLELLRARGMNLDQSEASAWLEHVGYYRLSGYWYPYRVPSDEPKQRLDHFVATTSFHDVALLYEFDRKLRGLVFDGIERLEVALRAALVAHVGEISPLAYLEPDTFRSSFDFVSWCETVNKRIERAQERNDAIRHWCAHHGRLWNQHFLPVSTAAFRTNAKLSNLPAKESKHLYGVLELITCVLTIVSPGSSWRAKIDKLITSEFMPIHARSISEIGYPV